MPTQRAPRTGPAPSAAAAENRPGVERRGGSHHFAVFAAGARSVELLAAEGGGFSRWTRNLGLARPAGAEGLWTGELAGLPDRFTYAFRVDGGAELLDPYAREVAGGEPWGERSWEEAGLTYRPYRSLWSATGEAIGRRERPPRPRVSEGERVIYELHLRGFTRHPSSAVAHPGTYLGLIAKIPYLRELGVTTVELLPVTAFDETENHRRNPATGAKLFNFWGYSPISWFAPHPGYASTPGAALPELAALVDALHDAGIEVVLDLVYNHTAEGGGGATDPWRSFRGLARDVYYIVDAATGRPFDCTGCGNTVSTNQPVVRRLILDSLRFWAGDVGVDGFRFDLASVFFRGLHGERLERSPIAEEIAADPLLRERLLIAEPWDVTGFSPAGGFPAPFRVWNGAFRDDLRRWMRGDAVAPREVALRLGGSRDLHPPRQPSDPGAAPRTVDFVTCHDGFTLEDLVSYATKHNDANGEHGHDGSNHNLSANHGVEGPSSDPAIRALRDRQVANLLALLLLTRATPMLLAGDERARSQRGNNNAWCHDDELSWIDWTREDRGRLALVRRLVALRGELAPLRLDRFAGLGPFETQEDGPGRAALLHFRGEADPDGELLLAWNPAAEPARLPLPRPRAGRVWRLAVDSDRAMPVPDPAERPGVASDAAELEVRPQSLRLLVASQKP